MTAWTQSELASMAAWDAVCEREPPPPEFLALSEKLEKAIMRILRNTTEREQANEKRRAYLQDHPEVREAAHRTYNSWAKRNAERLKAYKQEWYLANRDRIRERQREYRRKKKEELSK